MQEIIYYIGQNTEILERDKKYLKIGDSSTGKILVLYKKSNFISGFVGGWYHSKHNGYVNFFNGDDFLSISEYRDNIISCIIN